jgi:hypothetical protein
MLETGNLDPTTTTELYVGGPLDDVWALGRPEGLASPVLTFPLEEAREIVYVLDGIEQPGPVLRYRYVGIQETPPRRPQILARDEWNCVLDVVLDAYDRGLIDDGAVPVAYRSELHARSKERSVEVATTSRVNGESDQKLRRPGDSTRRDQQ